MMVGERVGRGCIVVVVSFALTMLSSFLHGDASRETEGEGGQAKEWENIIGSKVCKALLIVHAMRPCAN